MGKSADAIACLRRALGIFRKLGDRRGQAVTLRDTGNVLNAGGRRQQARAAWQEALAISEAVQLPETDEIQTRLASGQ